VSATLGRFRALPRPHHGPTSTSAACLRARAMAVRSHLTRPLEHFYQELSLPCVYDLSSDGVGACNCGLLTQTLSHAPKRLPCNRHLPDIRFAFASSASLNASASHGLPPHHPLSASTISRVSVYVLPLSPPPFLPRAPLGITLLPWITLLVRHWRSIDWLVYPHRVRQLTAVQWVHAARSGLIAPHCQLRYGSRRKPQPPKPPTVTSAPSAKPSPCPNPQFFA
jgi:hypothetical protein